MKWVILILTIGLCIYLTIDTTIYIVKKVKAKKQRKLEQQNEDNKESE